MNRLAILVLADVETHLGRVVNAVMIAKEFNEAGDDVQLIFDGAGTRWLGMLSDPEHSAAHELFEQNREVVSDACGSCSRAFDA